MKGSLIRLAAVAWLGPVVFGACAGDGNDGQDVGGVSAALQVQPGVTINSFTYAVSGPNSYMKMGTVDVSASSMLSVIISPLPAGVMYTLTAAATSVDGNTTCGGSASFAVRAQQTVVVQLHMTCHQPSRNGSARLDGSLNLCPTIDALGASPGEVTVGGSLDLTSTARDDAGPMPLSYLWTASSGTLASPTTASTAFTCTAAGTITVTLTASDGDPSPDCADTQTLTVTCSPAP